MSKRMKPADRKSAILGAAVEAARLKGFANFRLVDVAAIAECSNGLVISYFATMEQVKRAVMREAIRLEALPIIAAGLANGDKNCRKLPEALRRRAAASLGA